jgi:hypothetical protein
MGNPVTIFGQNYAMSKDYSKDTLKFYIKKYKALVMVIAGTNTTRSEMMTGEIKTLIEKIHSTGQHCIMT